MAFYQVTESSVIVLSHIVQIDHLSRGIICWLSSLATIQAGVELFGRTCGLGTGTSPAEKFGRSLVSWVKRILFLNIKELEIWPLTAIGIVKFVEFSAHPFHVSLWAWVHPPQRRSHNKDITLCDPQWAFDARDSMIDEDHNVDDGITRREDQIFLPRRQY